MSPTWLAPQAGEAGLTQHAHRLEVQGRLNGLEWPDLCPACGAPARERLTVRKVFVRRRGRRGRTRYAIDQARVPYCDGCITRHRAAEGSAPAPGISTYLQSFLITPAIGSAYLAYLMLPAARRAPAGAPGGLLAWAVVAFFVVICVGSVLAMMSETRRFRVRSQTEVTRAFDFSDELGNILQGRRRVYTIQNAAFAERFGTMNRSGPS